MCTTIPSYTESITEYLDILIGWKEKSVLDANMPEERNRLQRLASEAYTPYLHIQEPGELDNSTKFTYVWRRKEWDNHYAVQLALKQVANEQRKLANERTEKIKALGKCIKQKLAFLDDETIRNMATKILDDNNREASDSFGWKGEF